MAIKDYIGKYVTIIATYAEGKKVANIPEFYESGKVTGFVDYQTENGLSTVLIVQVGDKMCRYVEPRWILSVN
jgi:hypothetical protein